jgi:carnosine N-methyltransferase
VPEPELSEEELEYSHWYDVMRTFLMYEDFMELDIRQRQLHLNRLSEQLASALPPSSFEKIDRVAHASQVNQRLFEEIVAFQDYGFAPRTRRSEPVEKFKGPRVHYSQMHRNQAVLHSLAREWSAYGAHERSQAFQPLLDALRRKLPVSSSNLYHQRVLVPGCGLARLPLEIASCGYACEANEYSMFMLTASHFVLNGISRAASIPIYPWIDRVSNVVNLSDVFEPLLIPDISPVQLMNSCPIVASPSNDEPDFMRFTMAAGNFVELYGGEAQAGTWDAIVTCFFLDTAPVVME